MARQVLDNGIILPSEYSDDWYDDMTSNLTKLDEVIGSDAEKLSASDVGAAAISNDYDDLDDKPTYNILRRASVTLTAGGTGNYTDLDSDSKIKAGDYVLDAANKLYSITAIDAANSTYTVSAAAIINITDKSELGAAALSNSYDDLSNLPGYGILRFCSTAITDNSSVPFANISSVSKIAAGDFLLDTAAKLYQIASIDTVNETAAVTTPLTQLAVDSSVVHKSGDETVGGQKTLVNLLPLKGENLGTEASNNARSLLSFLANRDTQDQSGIFLTKFRQNKPQGGMSGNDIAYLSFDCLENSVRTNNGLRINFLNFVDDIPQRFVLWSGITERLLGATGAPWSDVYTNQINSLNPSSLSLPDLSNGIDISSYFDLSLYTGQTYTPTVNGWISISITSPNRSSILCESTGISQSAYGVTDPDDNNKYRVSILIPCQKNQTLTTYIRASGGTINFAKFYPCQGNV